MAKGALTSADQTLCLQALLGAKAQFEGDAAKKAQDELEDLRVRCLELENSWNEVPSMWETAVLRVVSSWIPPRDASPDDSSGNRLAPETSCPQRVPISPHCVHS